MTSTLLFCTSSKVTPELIRELQAADGECPVPTPYAPARHDPLMQHKPSQTEVEDALELFEDATDEDLERFTRERHRPDSGEKRNWLRSTIFLVLNERSALDKTVLLHANRTLYGPCWETIDGEDYDKDPEIIAEGWWVWRIHFDICNHMIALLDLKPEFQQELFLKQKQRFTNADGVFEAKRALDWYCRSPDQASEGEPGRA